MTYYRYFFSSNYGIAITFARWRLKNYFKIFRYYFVNHVQNILDCGQSRSRIYLHLHAKFGPARLRVLRAYSDTHTQTDRHRQVFN